MPYLSALEVCSRRGAIQIHVYLYLYPTALVKKMQRGTLSFSFSTLTPSHQIFLVSSPRSVSIYRQRHLYVAQFLIPKIPLVLQSSQNKSPHIPPDPTVSNFTSRYSSTDWLSMKDTNETEEDTKPWGRDCVREDWSHVWVCPTTNWWRDVRCENLRSIVCADWNTNIIIIIWAVGILHQQNIGFCTHNLQILCTTFTNSVQILHTFSGQFFHSKTVIDIAFRLHLQIRFHDVANGLWISNNRQQWTCVCGAGKRCM